MMWKILRNLTYYQLQAIGCTVEQNKDGDIFVFNKSEGNFTKISFLQGRITDEQMRVLRK